MQVPKLESSYERNTLRKKSEWWRERCFYNGAAIVCALIVFAGFARSFYLRPLFMNATPLSPFLVFHGVLFSSWIVLLIFQTALIAAKQIKIHRQLGFAGAVLACAMFFVGIATAINSAKAGPSQELIQRLTFLAIPLGDILAFGVLVTAGFVYRKRPEIHKRLMIVATVAILTPAIARLPLSVIKSYGAYAYFGINDLILLSCILCDWAVHRRAHPAYLWTGLVLVASQPIRLFIGDTQMWLNFARWLTS